MAINPPPEWGSFLPTPMTIKAVERIGDVSKIVEIYNPVWLAGLEAIVRQIVQDEIKHGAEARMHDC